MTCLPLTSRIFLKLVSILALGCLCPGVVSAQDQPQGGDNETIRYIRTPFTFRNMDAQRLAGWLRRFGVELPEGIEGQVNTHLEVQWPLNALANPKAYRIDGSLQSPQLKIGDFTLRNVVARVAYRDGVATLTELTFELASQPSPNEPPVSGGRVSGTARVELRPLNKIGLNVEVEGLLVSQIAEQLELDLPPLGGRLSLQVQAESTFDKAGYIKGWTVDGAVSGEELTIAGSPEVTLARTPFTLNDGTIRVDDMTVAFPGGAVTGSGRINLFENFAWEAALGLNRFDLATLPGWLPLGDLQPDGEASGRLALSGNLATQTWSAVGDTALRGARLDGFRARASQLEFRAEGTGGDLSTVEGRLAVQDAVYRDLVAEEAAASFSARDDNLILKELAGRFLGGEFEGDAQLSFDNQSESYAKLQWRQIDLERLNRLFELSEAPIAGESQGQIELAAPPGKATQWMAYRGQATASVERGILLAAPFTDGRLKLTLGEKKLLLDSLRAVTPAGPLSIQGEINLEAPYEFAIDYELPPLSIDLLAEMAQSIAQVDAEGLSGLAAAQGQARGSLFPTRLQVARGMAKAQPIQLGDTTVNSAAVQYELTEQSLAVSNIEAELYGGKVTGALFWPFDAEQNATAKLNWAEIDLGALAASRVELPWPVQAVSHGAVEWTAPAGAWREIDAAQAKATAAIPNLRVNGQEAGSLRLVVSTEEDRLTYEAIGSLFEGRLQASGFFTRLFADAVPPDQAVVSPHEGNFRLVDVDLGRLASVVTPQLGPLWSGRLTATMETTLSAAMQPQFAGRIELPRLARGGETMARSVRAEVEGDLTRVVLRQLSGEVAGGRLRVTGYAGVGGGRLAIELQQMSLAKLAALAGDPLTDPIEGQATLRLTAFGSRSWQAYGSVVVHSAAHKKLRLRSVRMPLSVSVNPWQGRFEIRSRDVRATLSRGVITGRLHLIRNVGGLNLDSQWRFNRVDLETLLQEIGHSVPGSGFLTGNLILKGRRIRAFEDLNGALVVELEDARATNVPLAPQIVRYVAGVASPASIVFREGVLQATLGRGTVRVQNLQLVSPRLQIYAEGRYTPRSGRIALDIIASTIPASLEDACAEILLRRLSLATPPTAALVAACDLLSNRLVYLRAGGTLRRPHLSIRAAPTLKAEAARFFLRQMAPELEGVYLQP